MPIDSLDAIPRLVPKILRCLDPHPSSVFDSALIWLRGQICKKRRLNRNLAIKCSNDGKNELILGNNRKKIIKNSFFSLHCRNHLIVL